MYKFRLEQFIIKKNIKKNIMRRIFALVMLLFVVCMSSLNAQTYYYKQESLVNENGVKSKGNNQIICITFVNSKRVCYLSDKDGNLRGNDQYSFRTTSNGVHIYTSILKEKVENRRNQSQGYSSWGINPNAVQNAYEDGFYLGESMKGFPTYKFSNDFGRLNISYKNNSNVQTKPTEVYIKVASPNESFDDSMY